MAYNKNNKARRKLFGGLKSLYRKAGDLLPDTKDDFHSKTSKKISQKAAKARKKIGSKVSLVPSANAATPKPKSKNVANGSGGKNWWGVATSAKKKPVVAKKKSSATKSAVSKYKPKTTIKKSTTGRAAPGTGSSAPATYAKPPKKTKRKGKSVGAGNRMVKKRKKGSSKYSKNK